ncbi:MAG: hypothetical protein C0392_06335 [Syntrophus sp. (in: bacteria)]|nr:hypothetical protein [Syntrophus sp. (in: bacteria)]
MGYNNGMSSFFKLFSRSFDLFSRHRVILYGVTIAIVVASLFALRYIKLSEDLQPLLPDGKSDAAIDFRFLQQAPFMHKVVINLEVGPDVDQKRLIEAADSLAAAMTAPYYSRAATGPDMPPPGELFSWLLGAAPSLMTAQDVQKVRAHLTPEGINTTLLDIRKRLNSSEGWVMKTLFQEDPLLFSMTALEKFRFLNMFKGMVLKENHFISADGRNALIVADTPIKITDSSGAKALADFTKGLIATHAVPGITVSFLSGHLYTTANAETIKEDLFVILACASLTILLLLFLFMQNWRAIFVFLIPTSVVCIATAGTLLAYQTISAITIAFGSVLMGIADDYPIFTYFSLRDKANFSGAAVSEISRPVIFSGITTMATFSALFFSDLPGQRQIALFAIIGIVASLAFSLIVLPHSIRGLSSASHTVPASTSSSRGPLYKGLVISGWLLVVIFCLWQGSKITFNGDMRSISMVPQGIQKLEEAFKKNWGDFRGTAMIFAEGKDLQTALTNNDRLFSYLKGKIADKEIISLAPILPSTETQKQNVQGWQALWSEANRNRVHNLFLQEGDKVGFAPNAFDPFFERLSVKPAEVTMEGLRKAGFGDIIDAMVVREGDITRVLTLVPDTAQAAVFFGKGTDTPFVARFVSQRRFNDTISKAMISNFIKYIIMASIVIILFLIFLFRNTRKVLYAMIPVVTGLIVMFGVMGWRGIEFNLFNIIATILVIGLSVDLGIFMVSRVTEGYDHNTSMAVLLGGLTSFVGMGALTLARHPALFSIGITVLLGMCGAIPSALFVIPAFYRARKVKII